MTARKSLIKIHDELVYYPHQLEGIRAFSQVPSFLLADEMGLGKSIQALTIAAIDFEVGKAKRVLIVCPATLKGNWGDEIEAHTNFTYHILQGDKAKREKQVWEFQKDILIVNYEQVEPHIVALNALNFDMVIYDEAHYMKKRTAVRTKACFKLTAPRHILLTGSPLLGQVDDLWALLHRIAPGQFPSFWPFINRYAVFGGFKDKQIVGVKNESELNAKLQAYMLRRCKKDVLDLPEKQRIVIKLDMTPEQRKLYEQAVEEMQISNPSGMDPMQIENAMVRFLRLKQICGTTACIPGHDDHSSKLDRAVEMIEEIMGNGEPVVVFTQFREVLKCLAARLMAKGLAYRELHGDVPIPDRQEVVRSWSADAAAGQPQALICMLQVAGVGLNMTAASKCIFLDKLFVPKLNEQAEDRLHRIGAKNTVQIFDLQMRGTIEARIERILKIKNTIFGVVVDVDNSDWKKQLIQAVLEDEEDNP